MMSLTNILISWSKSSQYISNGSEDWRNVGEREGERKAKRKWMRRHGEYLRGNEWMSDDERREGEEKGGEKVETEQNGTAEKA